MVRKSFGQLKWRCQRVNPKFYWTFEISIKNKKSVPVSITIEDQVPTSSDKQIDIDYEAVGAVIDKVKGRLTWKIDLKPLEDRKLKVSYTVKHPAEWQMWLE